MFLTQRYYTLSRNLFVSTLIVLTALFSLCAVLAATVMNAIHSAYSDRRMVTIPTTLWISSAVVTDWAIAAALVWELRRLDSIVTMRSTHHMIRRLMSDAIKTGAVTSLLVTSSIIVYMLLPETNLPVGIGFTFGRVYSLTMLYNINHRGGPSKYRRGTERDETSIESPTGRARPYVLTTMLFSSSSESTACTNTGSAQIHEAIELAQSASRMPTLYPQSCGHPVSKESETINTV
jgi:hypothetical protein